MRTMIIVAAASIAFDAMLPASAEEVTTRYLSGQPVLTVKQCREARERMQSVAIADIEAMMRCMNPGREARATWSGLYEYVMRGIHSLEEVCLWQANVFYPPPKKHKARGAKPDPNKDIQDRGVQTQSPRSSKPSDDGAAMDRLSGDKQLPSVSNNPDSKIRDGNRPLKVEPSAAARPIPLSDSPASTLSGAARKR